MARSLPINCLLFVAALALAAPTPTNIVQLAAGIPDLSTLVTALKAGNLVTALSGAGPFTVFAPTNEAFAKLPKAQLAFLLDAANVKQLDAVLSYHVVAGSVRAKDITDGQKIETLNGQDVTASIFMGTRIFINNALVTDYCTSYSQGEHCEADVVASNGVVHLIDTVLSPPNSATSTLFESIAHADAWRPVNTKIKRCPRFEDCGGGTFAALVKASNYAYTLLNDHSLPTNGPFTVLLPTDVAFAKLPKGTLDHLLQPQNIDELNQLLSLHIIASGKALRAGCTKVGRTCGPGDLEGDATKLGSQPAVAFWKALNGQSLAVRESGGFAGQDNSTTFIDDGTGIGASLLTFPAANDDSSGENCLASNGIWHVIDKVLMPNVTKMLK